MRKSPTIGPRICKNCGSEYVPSGTRQFYCPACRQIRADGYKKAYIDRKYPNRKPRMKCAELCCICGSAFSSHYDGKPYCNAHYLKMHFYGSCDPRPRVSHNEYNPLGDATEVLTNKGDSFLVDTSDLPTVQRYSWCFDPRGYVVANIRGRVTPLHRYLLNPPPGFVVDHISGDRSDNRRCNLRICTARNNAMNVKVSKNCKSGRLGIRILPTGKYGARIMVNRKTIHLGNFDTLEDALRARHEAEVRYFGEFAPSVSRRRI